MNIRFGVDYYPEHWPRTRWETDARLMRELGLDVVRMGEFSWTKMEPTEGKFDFSWLDEAIGILGAQGIRTVLGTPTPTPPAWIIKKNPEILPVDSKGLVHGYGGRHHDCQSNETYRGHIRRLVTAMAGHFTPNPHIVGWQIDNELGNSHQDLCHCRSCKAAFQKWLTSKYGDIDALNERWGTVFWSQTYDSFDRIPTPTLAATSHSPSLLLDWRRFHSDLIVDFQKMQIDIIRAHDSGAFITHNYMGFADEVDYYDLARDLDFVSHDQYPMGFFDDPQPMKTSAQLAAALDLIRGFKEKNFWIMEQQAGPTGWEILSRTPRPGQLALWTAQSVAHGAETVVFFRWRTCRFGTEEYWHGILPHDGRPGRRYDELKGAISALRPLMEEADGKGQGAEAAILYSFDQNWAFQIQPHHPDLDYVRQVMRYYGAFHAANVPVDLPGEDTDLSKYKLVFAPLQFLMNPEKERRFRGYVEGGGRLVLTMRTGVKDEDNVCMGDRALPGALGDLLGIEILDYDCLRDIDMGVQFEGKAYRVSKWCDIVTLAGAESLASYTEDYYARTPAVTAAKTGKGEAYYVAAEPDEALALALVERLCRAAGVKPIGSSPTGVELARRRLDDTDLVFALNHGALKATLAPPAEWETVLGGAEMEPYGVAVFKVPRVE